uniref:Chloride channel CLIC-like protein 1 n=1 Tax=Plectus sambesii TaxID=2011161 RepID=A0A914XNZ2_9BILA
MRQINRFLLIYILARFSGVAGQGEADSFDIPQMDKSKWIDPNDFQVRSSGSMYRPRQDDDASYCLSDSEVADLRSALSSCRLELNELKLNPLKLLDDSTSSTQATSNSPVSKCSTDPTLLKHVVHRLFIRLNLETKVDEARKADYIYEATLRISPSDVKTLQRFLDTDAPDIHLIQDARLAMETFLSKAQRVRAMDGEPTLWGNIRSNLSFYLQLGNLILLLPAAALVLRHISRTSLRKIALYLFFVIFCLSCVWTWLRLYKEKQAERQARYTKIGLPRACLPEKQDAFKAFSSYLSSLFLLPQADECLQYYKDIVVDPYLEVAPTEAVAITISLMILRPLKIVGENLADFIVAFYSRLPLTIAPLATILLLIFGLFSLLLFFGYRIRLPLFLGVIEPGPREVVYQPQVANVAAQQQLPPASAPVANAPVSQVHSLSARRDRSPSGGSLQDRARLTLRDSVDIDAGQSRRRDSSHRSISLPRVSDVNR